MTNDGLSYWQAESAGISLLEMTPGALLEQDGWRPTIFREMVAAGEKASLNALNERQASVQPTDPAQILYTSGTTVFPKGAVQTQRAILNNGRIFALRWDVQQGERICTASGKVQKFILHKQAIQSIGLEEAAQIRTA
jgi:acyl-CoA synthetase (AMP-forming)/AMP-acid ligase II